MSIQISNKKYAVIHNDNLNNKDIVVTTNGNYYAEEGYTGLGLVRVQVPVPLYETKTITPTTSVQEIDPSTGYSAMSHVTVNAVTKDIDTNIKAENIKTGITILGVTGTLDGAVLTTKTITTNGTYTPTAPYNGFSEVVINVDTVNNTDITVTDDGIYTPTAPYTGFGKVTVDLTWIKEKLEALNAGDADTTLNLQDITVTSAGSYTADPGYDGLGTVTVDLDWVDAAIAAAKVGTPDGTADEMIGDNVINISTDANNIRKYAFYYQSTLKKAYLNNALSIDIYAFANSTVEEIRIGTSTMCTLNDVNAFENTTLTAIKVPSALVSTYKADPNWSTFASIISAI